MDKFGNDNNHNENEKIRHNNYLIWLCVYISIILPFPISFGVLLLALFLLNIIRTELGGIKGLYKSLSSLEFGRSNGNGSGYIPLKFYCMNCGYDHRQNACPKCGSKAVKVG